MQTGAPLNLNYSFMIVSLLTKGLLKLIELALLYDLSVCTKLNFNLFAVVCL